MTPDKCEGCGYVGDFIDTETYCEDCGSHGAYKCPVCGLLYDRVYSEWMPKEDF